MHYHLWTKDEIKRLVRMWNTTTMEELAQEFGVSSGQINYMAGIIRKKRPDLIAKKWGRSPNGLVDQALDEL